MYLSPQVVVKETDLSNTVESVETSIIGFAGRFDWGPCLERISVTNERNLISKFGKCTDENYEDFLTAWNILQYTSNLYIVRAIDQDYAKNAGLGVDSEGGSTVTASKAVRRMNSEDETEDIAWGTSELIRFLAKYPSSTDDVAVAVANWKNFYTNVTLTTVTGSYTVGETVSIVRDAVTVGTGIVAGFDSVDSILYLDELRWITSGDVFTAGDTVNGDTSTATGAYSAVTAADAVAAYTSNNSSVYFSQLFEYKPEEDEIAVVVFKDDTVVETFIVSLDKSARDYEGNNIYIEELINRSSNYVYAYVNATQYAISDIPLSFGKVTLIGGVVSETGTISDIDESEIINAYNLFSNPEEFDVNILIDGPNTDSIIQNSLINIAEDRKDCIVILNIPKVDVVGIDATTANANVIRYRKEKFGNTSYGAFYNNWKYQYDTFNDKYRWVPISGDVAGIYAYTDLVAETWYAPAGLNRGQVKNVVKFAYNPSLTQRNYLYKEGINPVVKFPSDGPVVFGQKTLQTKASAFDRVDVRRLFIVLEKAISTSTRYFMFEKNTAFTRRRIKGMFDAYLRTVKGKEGVYDFGVTCDTTNNTAEVIDANQMVVDIRIQPTKTAEVMVLNFICTNTGVDISESVE